MTQQILSYVQVGVAVLLGVAILLQQKGQGLSGAFGGAGDFYRTKRGFEKVLLISTIILSLLFISTGIARIVIAPDLKTFPDVPLSIPSENATPLSGIDLQAGEQMLPLAIPDIEVKTGPQ